MKQAPRNGRQLDKSDWSDKSGGSVAFILGAMGEIIGKHGGYRNLRAY